MANELALLPALINFAPHTIKRYGGNAFNLIGKALQALVHLHVMCPHLPLRAPRRRRIAASTADFTARSVKSQSTHILLEVAEHKEPSRLPAAKPFPLFSSTRIASRTRHLSLEYAQLLPTLGDLVPTLPKHSRPALQYRLVMGPPDLEVEQRGNIPSMTDCPPIPDIMDSNGNSSTSYLASYV